MQNFDKKSKLEFFFGKIFKNIDINKFLDNLIE